MAIDALTAVAPVGAAEHTKNGHPAVAIIGLGYVGLPTAISFARRGLGVVGVDISAARLRAVERAAVDLPSGERGSLRAALDSGMIVTSSSPHAIAAADVVMICVPTPVDEHLVPDTEALRSACAAVVEHARAGQCIMLTSTSYVGTTAELLVAPLRARGFEIGTDLHVVFTPERIDPGNQVHPQHAVPRVVGGVTPACSLSAVAALEMIASDVHVVSSAETAEMTKLYENTFRAVNIAYANEMAVVAGRFGLDITEVIDAAATKPYGFMAFRPGPGVGGHCIPCDPHYLLWGLRAHKAVAPVIEAAMNQIALRPGVVVDRALTLLASLGRPVRDATVLVAGVAYKPGVADVRESPALEIIGRLSTLGAQVAFSDPLVESISIDGTGMRLERVERAQDRPWDLVIAHTISHAADLEWTRGVPAVLDTSYRLPPAPNRHTL